MGDVTTSSRWMAQSGALRRRHFLGLVLAGIVCSPLYVPSAGAAAPPAPRQALVQSALRMHGLAQQASSGSVRTSAADAARRLALAGFPLLWSGPSEVVAPSYGTRVFTNTAAALTDIQHLEQLSVGGLAPTVALIVAADRRVAQGAIAQARGAKKGLLAAAKRQLANGDQATAAGQSVTAVGRYAVAWKDAFRALDLLVSTAVTSVPSSALTAAATNALGSKKIRLAGPVMPSNAEPLTLAGKPELLYIGAEACPFCGIERWGLIVALSQFGTFSNLHLMQSLTTENPEVRSFSFFGSHYQSPYVSFVPVEAFSNVPMGRGFTPLQQPTPAQGKLFDRFDQSGQFPFVDVANRFVSFYSTAQPKLVAGMTWTQIARSLSGPSSIAAQAVAGEAEVITAEICLATNGIPKSVCSSAIVGQYEAALPKLDGKGGGCPASPVRAATRRRGAPPLAGTARCHI